MYIITGTLVKIRLHKKADLIKTILTAQRIENFMQTKINFDMGKNGRHRLSDHSRSIVVVRQ